MKPTRPKHPVQPVLYSKGRRTTLAEIPTAQPEPKRKGGGRREPAPEPTTDGGAEA